MQPWRMSAGLTAAVAGMAFLVGGSRLEYLASFWCTILAEYGLAVAMYVGLALQTVAAVLYCKARAVGLADLGRRVSLVERSIRRGEGDLELAEALRQDAAGRAGMTAATCLGRN